MGYSVSGEDWAILNLLWAKGDCTPGEIAQFTTKDKTTVTRQLDSLEKKGWINRRQLSRDKRQFTISVTREGMRLKEKLMPVADSLNKEVIEGISKNEQAKLLATLIQMGENLLTLKERI